MSESGFEEVLQSWKDLHQKIGNYLSEQEFEWGSEATEIRILHKIYFRPGGQVSHYLYRVINPEVSDETKEEYGRLLSDFLKELQIGIQRDAPFVQCGRSR